MNYQAKYDRLISYRQEHPATGYTERHHIVMRSMGGSDDPTNLVVLTGREHWIAHLLLHKIHHNSKTVYACHMMTMRCEERGIPRVRNSRMYEKIRIECAKLTSTLNKISHRGEGNSQYGTRWICNVSLQENKKISKEDDIPDGWVFGRNKWLDYRVTLTCATCNSEFKSRSYRVKYCSKACHIPLRGWKLSYETRQKMSNIKKELYKDPTRNPNYGKFKNKQTRSQQVEVAG